MRRQLHGRSRSPRQGSTMPHPPARCCTKLLLVVAVDEQHSRGHEKVDREGNKRYEGRQQQRRSRDGKGRRIRRMPARRQEKVLKKDRKRYGGRSTTSLTLETRGPKKVMGQRTGLKENDCVRWIVTSSQNFTSSAGRQLD